MLRHAMKYNSFDISEKLKNITLQVEADSKGRILYWLFATKLNQKLNASKTIELKWFLPYIFILP